MTASIEKMLLGKRYVSIELFSLNHERRFAFLVVQKKKDELVISKSEIFYDLKNLEKEKSNLPLVIIIND